MLGFIAGLVFGHLLTDTRCSRKEVISVPETHTPRPGYNNPFLEMK